MSPESPRPVEPLTAMFRYWHTLHPLRPRQVLAQLGRRTGLARPRLRRPSVSPRFPGAAAFLPGVIPGGRAGGGTGLHFLNDGRILSLPGVDWVSPGAPKLWRYNLHYFDYLHWPTLDPATKEALVHDWIARCPPGMPDAWEPYPVSLRVVNWIKYWLSGPTPSPAQLDSAASQLAWLRQDLEYHLLANHLLKNGKALCFGGLFFEGAEAREWLAKGLEILLTEADEQVLPDGGHFERSPMYHGIVLEDYLDVLNLARANPGLVEPAAVAKLAATARRAAGFLAAITAGDGRIPLFNDAAFGITPEPAELLAYGERVLEEAIQPSLADRGLRRICLPDTGYYGYRQAGDSFILDCGPVGPDYQPGHAHCDTLSYELCVDGHRVVVDAGVYGYEADEWRHYARRTSSHNTVELDGAEQSEIWGAFRVARRAYPRDPVLSGWEGGILRFRGGHDGYRRLRGRPLHTREVLMDPRGRWEIIDLMTGSQQDRHRVVNTIHLDCHISVRPAGEGTTPTFLLRHDISGLQLRLTVTCGSPARVEAGYHFPEFGLRRDNKVIVIGREGSFPLETRYEITRAP